MRIGALVLSGLLGLWGFTVLAGLTVLVPAAALADDAPPAAAQPSPQSPAHPPAPRANGSALAGLGFGDKPLLLADDGTFSETMNRLAAERQRSCGALESFAWEIADEDSQARVDRLTDTLLGSLRQGKFVVKAIKTKVLPASDLVAPYSAERADRHLLVLLTLSPAASRTQKALLFLLICDISHK